jgi:hypothetical protein
MTMNCATAMSASTAFAFTREAGRGTGEAAAVDIRVYPRTTLPVDDVAHLHVPRLSGTT